MSAPLPLAPPLLPPLFFAPLLFAQLLFAQLLFVYAMSERGRAVSTPAVAEAIGLTIPQALLLRADDVTE